MAEKSLVSKKEILFAAREKMPVIVELDASKGITYEVLLTIQKELETINIPVLITNGGIAFSVTAQNYEKVEQILRKFSAEMLDSDPKRDDAHSAGIHRIDEN